MSIDIFGYLDCSYMLNIIAIFLMYESWLGLTIPSLQSLMMCILRNYLRFLKL